MNLDIILEPDLTPMEIMELGQLAESMGFRGIWTQNYSSARDALMSLVPLAQQSRKILLGAVIYCPYEMHPMKIANSILTLNEYAKGRAMIVIGSGGEWPEVMMSPVFRENYGERLQDVKETLQIVREISEQGECSFRGEKYSAQRFSSNWHNERPPLIYHGACGPKMLAMGTYLADGSMMSDVMPEMLPDRMNALRRSKYRSSDSRKRYRISNFVAWHVRHDRNESMAEARRELIIRGWLEREWLTPYLSKEDTEYVLANRWPFLEAWLKRNGQITQVPHSIVNTLVEKLSLAGDLSDIDRHIGRLKVFEQAGFTEIALRVHERPAESIKLIAAKVLPEFKPWQASESEAFSA
jgi:alkanesulfonate monooxygenase SsuD/methylene tetrahydromethanopterin reductase-like flavin-dependent oxidoreductase (luciferase family)